jgi:hypothetical protein
MVSKKGDPPFRPRSRSQRFLSRVNVRWRAGDAVAVSLLWLWVTVSVGPWWIGMSIVVIGSFINGLTEEE